MGQQSWPILIRWPDWSLVTYSLIYGLGGNWICAFL